MNNLNWYNVKWANEMEIGKLYEIMSLRVDEFDFVLEFGDIIFLVSKKTYGRGGTNYTFIHKNKVIKATNVSFKVIEVQ